MNAIARLPLLFLGMLSLVVGVLAGLARLAVAVPPGAAAQAGGHGALMICAFLGTVISLERAVALARSWSYLAPACAGLGGLAMIGGFNPFVAQVLFIAAGSILSIGSLLILRQEPTLHAATLVLGAISWLAGSLVWTASGAIPHAVPWWMGFLILTIAGERLELTRFLPAPRAAKPLFILIVGTMMAGMVVAFRLDDIGLRIFAFGLLALALWLLRHDIARRTLRQAGLTRFIAACLLSGYLWLALGAVFGLLGGLAPGSALRDAALHAVFLGFVFSMIFGHALIIFPAVAKIRIPYHPVFYLPLAMLHASLFARIAGTLHDAASLRQSGAIANALALLVFVITLLSGAVRGRLHKTAS